MRIPLSGPPSSRLERSGALPSEEEDAGSSSRSPVESAGADGGPSLPVSSGTFPVASPATDVVDEADLAATPALAPVSKRGAPELSVVEPDDDLRAEMASLRRFKDETTAMLVHDLKSPLSAMMMNLDFALEDLRKDASAADVRTALVESRAAGAKLFRMIANLLDVARSDDGSLVPKRAVIDLAALFVRVIGEHVAEAQTRKVTISTRTALVGPVLGDADILGRALANLVDHALRYTPAGGHIVLGAERAAQSVVLTVTNDGRSIAPDARALVFERPSRGGVARVIHARPGLHFCRVAVEAHGGTIELADASPEGMCFRIELPRC
jgi:signal transduction histidine kinase